MESQDVEQYFQDLGDELELRGFTNPVRILVVGGVYMLLMVKNRKATEDVDIVLMDMPDTTNKTRETKAFEAAVRAVASKHRLKRKWMNDDVAFFIRDMAPEPEARLWRQYKKLEVYIPAQECILALKLMVFREKDRNDVAALLQALQITTYQQAQAIVDHFVPEKRWHTEYMLDDTLDELF